jgi:predicted lipoprotein with Yx(FWY)xxD motif
MQVAADGWPLYYFTPDEEPGDASGQGAGDVWWVLDPQGNPIKPDDTGDGDGNAADATVQVRSHDELDDILVGPDELTLYMFDQDEQGAGESACAGDCVDNWPPLTVEDDPVAGDGVAAELTTFERDDGSMQVAANGWPLYYFTPDEEPGDEEGQGVGDIWWVLDPDGVPVKPSSDSDDGGYGGGY